MAKKAETRAKVLKCKQCKARLKRILFDSRAKKPVYLYVCDNNGCPLYRQPQKYSGGLPEGVNITIV
jgi:predicted nucleic acid-binding Zn ribbon protein